MTRIPWQELGRQTIDCSTSYKVIASEAQRLIFLGLLLACRGPQATEQFSCHFCTVRKQTVEVDWDGFTEAVGKAGE